MINSKNGKRVLLFFPRNPYPFTDGNLKRFKQVLDAFVQRGANVYLLSSNFFNGPKWNEESVRTLKGMGIREISIYRISLLERKICSYFRKKRRAREKNIFDSADLNPIFMGFWFWFKTVRFKPDIVLINYIWWSRLLVFLGKPKPVTLIEMHDCVSVSRLMRKELSLFMTQVQIAQNDLEKMPEHLFSETYWDDKRMLAEPREMREYGKFDFTIAISEQERALVEKYSPEAKTVMVPYSRFPERTEDSPGEFVLFPAGKHIFNLHSYLFFVKKIWPLIKSLCPDIQLKVTGGLAGKVFAPEGIELLDFLPDIKDVYRKSRFAVCPVIAGTGQVIKVIDAMASGLPVVATRFAAQGSALSHDKNGYVAGTAENFSSYMAKLWKDPELCRKMGRQALDASRNHFENNPLNGFVDCLLNHSEL